MDDIAVGQTQIGATEGGGHQGPAVISCEVATVDLSQPLKDIDVGGARMVHLLATLGDRPVGTVTLPAPVDPLPVDVVVDVLTQCFAHQVAALERRDRIRGPISDQPRAPHGRVSVVIATRDRPESLARALRALDRQEGVDEVVVVDNDSATARTREVVEAAGHRYVHEPVPGLDRARNRGVVTTSGDILLMTDDDLEVEPGWAARLIEPFADPMVMAATGLVLPATMRSDPAMRFEAGSGFGRGFARLILDGSVDSPYGAGRAGAGASMAFRRGFLLAVGGFPEELDAGTATASGGDTYALAEVMRHGFRIVFEPRALARHHHRDSDAALERAVRGYGTGSASWLASAAVRHRDPAALLVGGRTMSSYLGRKVLDGLLPRAGSGSLSLALTEVRGFGAAVRGWPVARRAARQHPPVFHAEPRHMPTVAASMPRRTPDLPDALPPLSVVIPSRGRRRQLRDLLERLSEQSYPGEVEVVVVLDGDVDGSEDMLRRAELDLTIHPVVLTSTSMDASHGNGAAVARNAGIDRARGDRVLFLDDDVRPTADHLLACHGGGGGDVLVGPVLPVIDGGVTTSLMAMRQRAWWSDHAMAMATSPDRHFADVCTGNLSAPRHLLEELGGFLDVPRREDWEFGWRVMAAGHTVRTAPAAAVTHPVDGELGNVIADRAREGAGDVAFMRRHLGAYEWLLLSSWDATPLRRREVLMAAMDDPARITRIACRTLPVLHGLEAAGLRRRHDRLLRRLLGLSYWAGVGQAAGGADGWLDLLSARRRQPVEAVDWHLGGRDRPLPRPGGPSTIRLVEGDRTLGLLPARAGGIPWDREQLADALFDQSTSPQATHVGGI